MRFIGIDLHYNSFIAVYLSLDKLVKSEKIYLDHGKEFQMFLDGLTKEDYIAIESSTNSFWFYDQVCKRVKGCYVINASRFSIIYSSNKKTDKIDANKIAKKLRYKVLCNADEDEFPTVYVPKKPVQELRTLFTTYELLQKQKTQVKNRIFSLLVGQGYYIEGNVLHNKKNRDYILKLEITDSTRFQIEILFDQIDLFEKKLDKIKSKILEIGSFFKKEIDLLISIKGVSIFVAIAILTDIADVNRFKSAKKLCSYLRTAPKIDSSNKTERIGCVNKQSRKLALKMLLQGISHAYRSSPYLYGFYKRKKKGKKVGKVRIAIARKIFTAVYHMLKKDKYFYWIDELCYKYKSKEYENYLSKFHKSA